ncbi:MAG TPA: glycosyltransferase [Pyrinomonadaceae bacterium]|nr:glycosyltransferase [Pyrinomonadaceae bacterium]
MLNHKPKVSVIICTHNPRRSYLTRVLHALRKQTLALSDWELVLVDNASSNELASWVDISWHPRSRVVVESVLGLTPARQRGIAESCADLLVFCDDDNVLAETYLEEAFRIAESRPDLGAWGGQLLPDFESEPPEWTRPYWHLLAIGWLEEDRCSNQHDSNATPCGAGLCIRRTVVDRYSVMLREDSKRLNLDRRGRSLMSGGDTDMALTACDMGLATGLFSTLKLQHLIPSQRVTAEYLLAMREAQTFSGIVLASFRNGGAHRKSSVRVALEFARAYCLRGMVRRFRLASLRGELKAYRTLKTQLSAKNLGN